MEQESESVIRFLAVERGLSENYQLSTQRSLGEFAAWCAALGIGGEHISASAPA
jgi:site-specific recombinase XerD